MMEFVETSIEGVFIVRAEPSADDRGYFARTYCADEFSEKGLTGDFTQSNVSFNIRKSTLRGMHYQIAPYEECKLVRVTQGRIFDVALDLRRQSPTYLKWFGIELCASDLHSLYIPAGCAHGFQSLEDNSSVLYLMNSSYQASHARGVRWNDPSFNIQWPLSDPILSPRDAIWDDWRNPQRTIHD